MQENVKLGGITAPGMKFFKGSQDKHPVGVLSEQERQVISHVPQSSLDKSSKYVG